MQRTTTTVAGVLAALLATISPVSAQTYFDGQDLTGTPLDCRSANRTLPTVERGSGAEIRLRGQTEDALAERSRVSLGRLLSNFGPPFNNTPLALGELGFTMAYYTPSAADGSPLFGSTGSINTANSNAFLPLCAIALTSDLQRFDARISELEGGGGQTTGTRLDNVELAIGEIARAAALAGVLDIAMPTNGRSNRLGVTVHEGYREEAIGVSYVRVQGSVDIGVAVGYSGGQSSGKASVGFSW